MKKVCFIFVLVLLQVLCSSCFSLLKADRLIHYGSFGKKPDAVVMDSVINVNLDDKD